MLFRSVKAPLLYENDDIYNADARLGSDELLPDSDLSKALHSYASDFYMKTTGENAEVSFHSLDGSALLALGTLLEESCQVLLGSTGDLALTECDLAEESSPDCMNVSENFKETETENQSTTDEDSHKSKRRKFQQSRNIDDDQVTEAKSSRFQS